LHRVIICSAGADCCDASALRAGKIPPLTPRARKRKTPQNSWINFVPALSRGGKRLLVLRTAPLLRRLV
jgi:hypothetical protein